MLSSESKLRAFDWMRNGRESQQRVY